MEDEGHMEVTAEILMYVVKESITSLSMGATRKAGRNCVVAFRSVAVTTSLPVVANQGLVCSSGI
jgi:hypothetical protein